MSCFYSPSTCSARTYPTTNVEYALKVNQVGSRRKGIGAVFGCIEKFYPASYLSATSRGASVESWRIQMASLGCFGMKSG